MKKFLTSRIFVAIITAIIVASVSVYATIKIGADEIGYKDGTVEDALDDLYDKANSNKKYISLDKNFLESGTLIGNTVITEDNPNALYGLSITGAGNLNGVNANRWEKEIDFTNLSILTFYAKKMADHGSVRIMVDEETIYFASYSELNNTWKKCFADLTKFQGTHKLVICGGWGDTTGSSSSNTQYYDIRLY